MFGGHRRSNNCVCDRLRCFPVPDDGGFTLVVDSHGCDILGADVRPADGIRSNPDLSRPYFVGIMFNPTDFLRTLALLMVLQTKHAWPLIER
jgi:hypothetical protein